MCLQYTIPRQDNILLTKVILAKKLKPIGFFQDIPLLYEGDK